MWLAIVMFCAAPVDARTCNLTVNNENLYNDKQSCDVEMRNMVDQFASRGIFSQGTCVEIGVPL
tara:strand:- start:137 stop:328 length:192 start_codon:yes stop_codon:yes gene_type:complete